MGTQEFWLQNSLQHLMLPGLLQAGDKAILFPDSLTAILREV